MKLKLFNKEIFVYVILDLILLITSYLISKWMIFPNLYFVNYLFILVILKILVFNYFHLYRFMSRYVGINDLFFILKAIFVCFFIDFIFGSFSSTQGIINLLKFSLNTAFISLIFISGIRFIPRLLLHLRMSKIVDIPVKKRILIVGANGVGELFLRQIDNYPELGYVPVGFIDERKEMKGHHIHNMQVLGTIADLEKIIRQKDIEELVLTPSYAKENTLKPIINICNQYRIGVKILPTLQEFLFPKRKKPLLRKITPEDLLRREINSIDYEKLNPFFYKKRILITGAGGSIGSQLVKQLLDFSPSELILIDNSEYNIFELEEEVKGNSNSTNLNFLIADIRDNVRIEFILKNYMPDIVFHAAAYKHVNLMDRNPWEAITNNLIGTINIAKASLMANVKEFIFISSDKAVEPKSIMGASKAVGEVLMQSLNRKNGTKFITVRFGNVIGSKGSVIPVFEKRIKANKPLVINHPQAKRYFMATEEAVQLMLQAAVIGEGGEIFILDMGRQMKIIELAYEILKIYNLQPGKDIEIKLGKLGKGEKIEEELLAFHEFKLPTQCKNIYLAESTLKFEERFSLSLRRLKEIALRHAKFNEKDFVQEIIDRVEEEIFILNHLTVGEKEL